MASNLEYAQLATDVYARLAANDTPLVGGWTQVARQIDDGWGFSASAYIRGAEVVIAFAGTNEAVDWGSNIPAAAGLGALQMTEALTFALDVMSKYPGATFSLTGHSLGGGLASVLAVFLNLAATVFDPAPFELSARNPVVLGSLQAYLFSIGYNNSAFDDYTSSLGALFSQRESNVISYNTDGEILELLRAALPAIIGQSYEYIVGTPPITESVPKSMSVDLHSMDLLSSVMRSQSFREGMVEQNRAFSVFADSDLYQADSRLDKGDFMARMHNWQLLAGGGAGILDMLGFDLKGIGTSGTVFEKKINRGVLAALAEYYYFQSGGVPQSFIDLVAGGIQINLTDIEVDSDHKGQDYLKNSIRQWLVDEDNIKVDDTKIERVTLQSGGDALLVATEQDAESDLIIGGEGADQISAGAGDDILIGLDGNDTIRGGAGRDVLYGGDDDDTLYAGSSADDADTSKNELYGGWGNDTLYGSAGIDLLNGGDDADTLHGGDGYDIYNVDNQDTVMDTDGRGAVYRGNMLLTGGSRKEGDPENTYNGKGDTYVLNGHTLIVNGGLTFEEFTNGDLGIYLKTEPEDPLPPEKPDFSDAEHRTSPIVIDLDGDGVETLALSANRFFDHDANGMQESTAWAGSDDGFLVRDLDGNGRIDTGREMFGTNTRLQNGQLAANGYEALKDLDTNQDGVLDETDAAFSELRIWRDVNSNGWTDAGELMTLSEAGIASFNTQWINSTTVDANGQLHAQVGTAIRTNGVSVSTADVWFQVDTSNRINVVPLNENMLDVVILPNASAFGNLPDLRQAMALDPVLIGLVEAYVAEQNPIQRDTMLEGLIFQWAGVANVDPNSRDPRMVYGHVMDARQLIVLEKLVGRGYEGTWCWGERDPNPHGNAAPLLIAEFKEFQNYVRAQLLVQVDPVTYSSIKAGFASGYSSAIVDWQEFQQTASALRTAGDLDKLGEIIGVMRILGTYSADFRMETAQAFADLQATYPDLTPLFNTPSVIGTIGNDSLFGGYQGEVIVGDKGDDSIFGGGGNDSYYYRAGDGKDRIYDSSGTDQLVFMEGIAVSNVAVKRDLTSITLTVTIGIEIGEVRIDNVFDENGHVREGVIETIKFHDGTFWLLEDTLSRIVLPVTPGDDVLYGSIIADTIFAQGGNDQLFGLDGDDHLDGEGGNDILVGGNGNDTLIGGAGDDLLNAGAGNDTYVFAAGFGHDVIENYDDQTQRLDKIEFATGIAAGDMRATRDGEDLVLTHINGDTIRVKGHYAGDGNGSNSIDEVRFADGTIWDTDTLKASALSGTSGNDTLTGYASNDAISGLSGNDTIYGRSGDDQLDGGEGNDRLYGEEGNDTLLGADGNDVLEGGNGDDALDGGAGNDQLYGGYGGDLLLGGEGDDNLLGDAGDDQLVGGTGKDRLEGGFGDDRYYFARGDGKDTILDVEGHSTIYVSNLLLSEVYFRRDGTSLVVLFTSSADDEIRLEQFFAPDTGLALRGIRIDPGNGAARDISPVELDLEVLKASSADDVILGNALDNVINALAGNDLVHGHDGNDLIAGGDGNDVLYGDEGNDTLAGDAGDDQLFGGEGADILQGGVGNDTLDGGEGADSLAGGSGDDRYRVDAVGDTVVETAGEGADTIESTVSFTLPANVETLRLIGNANIDATGGSANDRLIGNAGSNILTGGAGNDVLDGAGGVDTLIGGAGDDTFIVDRSDDVVTELANEGYDTVEASSDYTLPSHVEKLVLTGWANTGIGNGLDNVLVGNANGNRLDGGAGADQMIGGDGDDTYVVDNASDVIVELAGEGNDTVESSINYVLNDVLENIELAGTADLTATGNNGNNFLRGNSGNNVLDGLAGADNMAGGAGNDYYIEDEAGDNVQEGDDAGIDTIERHYETNYILTNNIENLILGSGVTTGHGNDLDNHIIGNAGNNSSLGLDGNDLIEGLGGDDALFGGEGDDVLLGGSGNDYLDGGEGTDQLNGGDGADQLGGGAGSDSLIGGLGDDKYVLTMDGETDLIDNTGGGFDGIFFAENISTSQISFKRNGNDLLIIVDGDETAPVARVLNHFLGGDWAIDYVQPSAPGSYYMTTAQINAKVTAGGTGFDTVMDGTEGPDQNGTALVGGTGKDWIRGLGGDDHLFGNAGDDKLQGGAGNDYLAGGLGNDTNTGNDTLEGGDGNDTLAGQDGDDQLIGGAGNDNYMWGGGLDTIDNTGGGTDNLFFPSDVTISRMFFSQDGNDLIILVDNNPAQGVRVINHFLGGDLALDYVGPNGGSGLTTAQMNQKAMMGGYDNVVQGTSSANTLNGTAGKDLMFGGGGNDTLNGAAGDDRLLGEAGNDTLYGGVGSDRLEGGPGDDTYTIDDNQDVIVEIAGEGNDLVNASVSYTLGENVERLTLTGSAAINGTGNALDNVLTGNGAANTLVGGAGNDSLNGGAGADSLLGGEGNDTYVIDNVGDSVTELENEGTDLVQSSVTYTLGNNVENLTLTGSSALTGTGNELDNVIVGNTGANTLRGYAGNDILDGGAGNDTMIGGVGNDTYVVNATGDVVTELAGEGTDLVQSSVTYTLGNNVENMTLTGTAAINGTGNSLDNVLIGNSGKNTLTGGAGNDVLDGGAGIDTMVGGTGDDIYFVDVSGDVVTEQANQGSDTVIAAVTYTLSTNLEHLTLSGTANINGTGHASNNYLTGNAGNNTLSAAAGDDVLDGGAGTDTLTGGTGKDTYLMARGYGSDTVVENDSASGQMDVAKFLSGVAFDQLWFAKPSASNNLEISIIGTYDKLIIKDWYLGSKYRVEEIRTAAGNMMLSAANVQDLVTAMASLTKPAFGQTTLSPSYQTQLASVFASTWVSTGGGSLLAGEDNQVAALLAGRPSGNVTPLGMAAEIMPVGSVPVPMEDQVSDWLRRLVDSSTNEPFQAPLEVLGSLNLNQSLMGQPAGQVTQDLAILLSPSEQDLQNGVDDFYQSLSNTFANEAPSRSDPIFGSASPASEVQADAASNYQRLVSAMSIAGANDSSFISTSEMHRSHFNNEPSLL